MSNSDLMFDVRQANELKLAFRRARFSNGDIKRLCESNVLADVRPFLRGHASINVLEHIIDCDAAPFSPTRWQVIAHQKAGSFIWTGSQVQLWLGKRQQDDHWVNGNELRKELKGKPVLNACVLDYLLVHQELIPEQWKDKAVFFWGTIYRYRNSDWCVRSFYWNGDRWVWSWKWLSCRWDRNSPAAVRAADRSIAM